MRVKGFTKKVFNIFHKYKLTTAKFFCKRTYQNECTDRKQNAGHKLGIGGKSRKYIIYRCHYKSCYCHKSW